MDHIGIDVHRVPARRPAAAGVGSTTPLRRPNLACPIARLGCH